VLPGHLRHRPAQAALGLVDVVLFADPSIDELQRRGAADTARQRRNFERHIRLAEPLREWYAAIASVGDADRVRPLPDVVPTELPPVGSSRTDPAVLDQLLAALPTS
jgi:hypothetical protein